MHSTPTSPPPSPAHFPSLIENFHHHHAPFWPHHRKIATLSLNIITYASSSSSSHHHSISVSTRGRIPSFSLRRHCLFASHARAPRALRARMSAERERLFAFTMPRRRKRFTIIYCYVCLSCCVFNVSGSNQNYWLRSVVATPARLPAHCHRFGLCHTGETVHAISRLRCMPLTVSHHATPPASPSSASSSILKVAMRLNRRAPVSPSDAHHAAFGSWFCSS